MAFQREAAPRLSSIIPSEKKEASRHIINKKADAKLDHVVELYRAAAGGCFVHSEKRFLEKCIRFRGLRFLEDLHLRYRIENRFWAISYDLCYEFFLEDNRPLYSCAFAAALKGRLSIRDAEMIIRADGGNDSRLLQSCLNNLNIALIRDRMVALDLTALTIEYRSALQQWKISCRSLIGSTTWNLIPPVTQLIRPRQAECLKMIELFELLADAVLSSSATEESRSG